MTDTPDTPATADHAARAADLERRLTELETSSRARLVRAELKAEAVRAGMVDLDGLKLVELAGVVVKDDGEVANAPELMRELKRAKPWLFGAANSSSSAAAPPAEPLKQRRAAEMSYAEWQAARSELLRQR